MEKYDIFMNKNGISLYFVNKGQYRHHRPSSE